MSSSQAQSPRRDQSRVVALRSVGLLLVLAIAGLVNYISYRRYERWDLTRDKIYTLSDRTESLLAGLEQDVDMYVFLSQAEPVFHDLRELLNRYREHSDHIHTEFIDPDREPTKFKVSAEKLGVRVGLQEDGRTEAELAVLVKSGERRWSITRDDLINVDLDSLEGSGRNAKVDVKTEQALSGAIVQVTTGRPTKVCVTEGHGEWSLDGEGQRPLTAISEELKRENIKLEALSSRGKAKLPETCDAIFVLGPNKPFSAAEADALKAYLAAGGNLLLAVDPVVSGTEIEATGLEEVTEAFGISLDRDIVVELDSERLLTSSPVEHFLAVNFGDHQVVRPLRVLGAPVVMALARSLSLSDNGDAEALVSASEKAYGETSLTQLAAGDDLVPAEGDVPGPIVLAAAVETLSGGGAEDEDSAGEKDKKKAGGRLVVVGDSDFLSQDLVQQPQLANVDLLATMTGYLTEREALVAIAPRKVDAQGVIITDDDLSAILWRTVLLMPLAVCVLGVGVWWQRKQ